MIADLVRYREYIWRNGLADLRHRHAGASLGWAWLALVPLAQIGLYSVVFSRVMQARLAELGDLPVGFTIYLCAGLLPYLGFADIVTRCTGSLVVNARYLLRSALPEPVVLAREALSGLMAILIGVSLLLVLAPWLGLGPAWAWVCVPAILILLATLAFGLGMLLGVLNVFSRDVAPVVAVVLQLWLWATPIVYVESMLPSVWRQWLPANPLYVFVSALQDAILFGTAPGAPDWAWMVGWTAAAGVLGYAALRRLRPELRDAL